MNCIEIKGITKDFKNTRALNNVNLTFEENKIYGLLGRNGAGKSTLLNTLTKAAVLEEDKLFATLDPTTRVLEKEDGQKILFTDTVGFILSLIHI